MVGRLHASMILSEGVNIHTCSFQVAKCLRDQCSSYSEARPVNYYPFCSQVSWCDPSDKAQVMGKWQWKGTSSWGDLGINDREKRRHDGLENRGKKGDTIRDVCVSTSSTRMWMLWTPVLGSAVLAANCIVSQNPLLYEANMKRAEVASGLKLLNITWPLVPYLRHG